MMTKIVIPDPVIARAHGIYSEVMCYDFELHKKVTLNKVKQFLQGKSGKPGFIKNNPDIPLFLIDAKDFLEWFEHQNS